MPTVTFKQFDVVRVPFPFSDKDTSKNRPAVVLSNELSFNAPAGHSVMAMITSAGNPDWPLDCPISSLESAGLPKPSKVRFKLFTLDHQLVRGVLGQLAPSDAKRVQEALTTLLKP